MLSKAISIVWQLNLSRLKTCFAKKRGYIYITNRKGKLYWKKNHVLSKKKALSMLQIKKANFIRPKNMFCKTNAIYDPLQDWG